MIEFARNRKSFAFLMTSFGCVSVASVRAFAICLVNFCRPMVLCHWSRRYSASFMLCSGGIVDDGLCLYLEVYFSARIILSTFVITPFGPIPYIGTLANIHRALVRAIGEQWSNSTSSVRI